MLINPPQAQPFLPNLAPALLTSVLKKEGYDVIQKDYNLEAYEDFLSEERLKKSGVSPFVASQVEYVKNQLRSGLDYFLPGDYFGNIAVLEDYLTIISRQYEGCSWSLKDFDISKYRVSTSEDILKASVDNKSNLFVDYFEEKVKKDIVKTAPNLVGISISWTSQVFPAFALCRKIKKHLPSAHVCVGGSLIGHLADYLRHKRKMFTMVDSFVPFEGEETIVKLARQLKDGKFSGKNIPGLIYLKGKKVWYNQPETLKDLNELPCPDFDDLPLNLYYSPQVYLPLAGSRGCYWGRCAFCTHHLSGVQFRRRNAETIFKEMKSLYTRYSCKNFYFVDDAAPPATLKKVADLIAEKDLPFRWAAEIRIEKNMDSSYFEDLYRGGCRLILFGLESYCQRILDLMDKGVKRETAKKAIRAASEAGIKTWVFFFLGFPGERRHEAKKTLQFIVDNREHIDMVAGGTFVLTRNSKVFLNQQEFPVKEMTVDREKDLQLIYPAVMKEGLQKDEARKMLDKFRREPEVQKFLESFVSEPHLLFFRKSYFKNKNRTGR